MPPIFVFIVHLFCHYANAWIEFYTKADKHISEQTIIICCLEAAQIKMTCKHLSLDRLLIEYITLRRSLILAPQPWAISLALKCFTPLLYKLMEASPLLSIYTDYITDLLLLYQHICHIFRTWNGDVFSVCECGSGTEIESLSKNCDERKLMEFQFDAEFINRHSVQIDDVVYCMNFVDWHISKNKEGIQLVLFFFWFQIWDETNNCSVTSLKWMTFNFCICTNIRDGFKRCTSENCCRKFTTSESIDPQE